MSSANRNLGEDPLAGAAQRAASRLGRRSHYGKAGKHSLSRDEVARLLTNIPHLEDEALFRLAIATGIRREDIVAIPLEGVNLETATVTFWESKKRRTHAVPIGGECLNRLRQHVNGLPKGSRWLFPSPRNPKNHMTGRHAYNILQDRLKASGLASRPFHALRSTCIKEAQRSGWTIEQVMELTGDTFRTIKEHYDTPTPTEMAEVARSKPFV